MSLFAIGDPHLSFSTDKPMNIFKGWDNYVERLEKNWKNIVTDNDTVVIAGDVSWAMSLKEATKDFEFIDSLPGQKIILKGNHDYWWDTKTKMEKYFAEHNFDTLHILFNNAYRVGDISVCGTRGWFFDDDTADKNKVILREAGRLRMSIQAAKELGGTPMVFLHYPPVTQLAKCDEIYNVLIENGIENCYYAHLHSYSKLNAVTGLHEGIKFSLISGDYLEFCPKKIS